MKWILSAEDIQHEDRQRVGGKGYALTVLANNGFQIPETLCISSDTYQQYVEHTGLRERIQLELHRKDFKEMRWEEIWDCATRIRNMFLRKQIPEHIAKSLKTAIQSRFKDNPVAVRSSATAEDLPEAVLVDPDRDINAYLDYAKKQGLRWSTYQSRMCVVCRCRKSWARNSI